MKNVGLTGFTEDCAIKEIGNNQSLVTNVDIFTPIIDDPVIQGEITACNATNDVFALNVLDIISYLSFIGVPPDQPEEITEGLLQGQRNFLKKINADINGGHSIVNPWPLMGGIAVGLAKTDDIIKKQMNPAIKKGELLITKPLGIQASMASYRVRLDEPEFLEGFNQKAIQKGIDLAIEMMRTSNYHVVKAIAEENLKEYIASMTDVTGFGIKKHSEELLENKIHDISIDTLPVIYGSVALSDLFAYDLLGGCAAETAGPMLICIDTNKIDTEEFQRSLAKFGVNSWKIGNFQKGKGNVEVKKDLNIIEVESYN